MSECKVYRRELEEAADGGHVGSDARAHINACRACGEELRGRQSLRALVGGLGTVEAPADFEFRLRARMAAAKAEGDGGRFRGARWFYGFAPVAIAACFVLVSSTLYFRQSARPQKGDAPAAAAAKEQNLPTVPAFEVKEVARASQTEAASPVVQKPLRRVNVRATRAREVASIGERRADAGPRTLDRSVTGALVLHPISVKASAEPLQLILRDERGAERVVPMRSVSFGSQDVLARGAATRPSAPLEVGGVW